LLSIPLGKLVRLVSRFYNCRCAVAERDYTPQSCASQEALCGAVFLELFVLGEALFGST